MKFAPIFLLFISCGIAFAAENQLSPAEVTEPQIARYKKTAEKACRDAGLARSDAEEMVTTFCRCVLSGLEKSMTQKEWQQVYVYSQTGKESEEREVLAPHFKTLTACRPSAPAPAPQ